MNRIFLDIGAYTGDTTQVIINGKYNFDVIHCFEPTKRNCDIIKNNIKDDRVILHRFGLFDQTASKMVYCAGSDGASVFKDKRQPKAKQFPSSEMCEFVKASDWFRDNILIDDFVIVKINAEGSEIEILNDLLDSEEYSKINNMLLSFDVGKIKGKEYLQKEMVERLSILGKDNYITQGDLKDLKKKGIIRNNQKSRITYWLNSIEGVSAK